jgi:hypothetical protein
VAVTPISTVGKRLLVRREVRLISCEEATHIAGHDSASRFVVGGPFLDQHGPYVRGDAGPGLAHAGDGEDLVAETLSANAHRAHQGCHRHRPGTLNVVVEREDAVGVALEERECFLLGEILPLQKRARVVPLYAEDEALDELVVRRAREALAAVAGVDRIGQQALVVRADVEADGKTAGRV